MIIGSQVFHKDSEKSISALDALDKAVKRYDESRLLSYDDLNNTFPVWITVKNIARQQVFEPPSIQKLPVLETTEGKEPATTPETGQKSVQDGAGVPSIQELTAGKSSPYKRAVPCDPLSF